MTAQQITGGLMQVAVVDDDDSTRVYFKDIIQSVDDLRFAGQFSNATEALVGIPLLRPDLVLMDFCMPDLNGIECAKQLKCAMPHLKIIIMTGSHNLSSVEWSLRAGASAYLIKPITMDQCLATLRFVAVSEIEINPKPKKSGRMVPPSNSSRTHLPLSPREKEVMAGLAEGLLYKEISEKLGISYSAVHKYQHKIFEKFQVSNRSEAIRLWLDLGGE
jgi:DNA-binding NarL/FixJ family response regulator